jgi:hypothetical protein
MLGVAAPLLAAVAFGALFTLAGRRLFRLFWYGCARVVVRLRFLPLCD